MKRGIAAVCLAVVLTTPLRAASGVGPAPLPPPYAGAYQPQGVDEIGLWREDDDSERSLAASPILIRDEALTAYVKAALCTAVGADRCNATRVYIVREPSFNATMSPNGTMRVFSGLLLRARSEAELAYILGHEFGHFEHRHTLTQYRARRTGSDVLSWATVLASMANSRAAYRGFRDLEFSVYGSLMRFGRDDEREADRAGIGYLNASTLRPQAAARIWHNLMAESEASAKARGLKKPRFDRIVYYASHPPEAERAASLGALAVAAGDTRDDGAARYKAALAKWLPVFLDDQIKLNDLGGSEYLIGILAQDGWTAPLWQARGELFRARGTLRDLVNAARFYANAIALDPMLAEAHRGLGLALVKTGRAVEGRVALERYLELAPAATDAAMIAMTIRAVGGHR
jgi:Zn-dependent protease with chaperone function